ncbi:hypothetical protein BDZ45DRAFT_586482 [Acephala macrosclerotiorum]|nr:hypothetical protein BDZ45DRAFT_586482 [Acephala macrosclerotiorum]
MAPELSSNWKKLQATLQQEAKDKHERKRKAIPTDRQQNTIAAKRRRLDSKPFKATPEPGLAEDEADEAPNNAPSASLALWAEDNDISAKDLAEAYRGGLKDTTIKGTRLENINGGLVRDVEIGKYVGIDCEMVGVGGEEDRSVLARVSIVNFHGTQVYDSFVRPKEFVTDWRTHVSGVSPKNMATARDFDQVQEEVAAILKGRIVVGHAIKNDLAAMMLGHPKRDIRDTSRYSGFRKYSAGRTPSLRKLTKEILGVEIQKGEHSSIEDAQATMLLFRRHKSGFDVEHAARYPPQIANGSSKSKPKSKKKKKAKR